MSELASALDKLEWSVADRPIGERTGARLSHAEAAALLADRAEADEFQRMAEEVLTQEREKASALANVVGQFIAQARDKYGLGRFMPDELPLLDEMARLASALASVAANKQP